MKHKLTILCLILVSLSLIGWSSKDGALVKAVNEGKTIEVQNLLNQGANPNIRTTHGQTLLMIAAKKGYVSIAELLLKNGAEIAAVDRNGKTALLIARENQRIEMVKLLNDWHQADRKQSSTPFPTMDDSATISVTNITVPAEAETPVSTETTVTPETESPPPTQSMTAAPEPTQTQTPEPSATTKGDSNQYIMFFFDFNQASLKADYAEQLKNIVPVLNVDSGLYIILGGHSDEVGTFRNSLVLSRRRAETVKQFLIAAGISGDRIIIYAYGKEHPAKTGHDEASRAFNRRVDVMLSKALLSATELLERTVK